MTSLTILNSVPTGFLEAAARNLHGVIDGPTLIELEGEKGAPLFVSGLMHGNEDSGLVAIQKVLREFAGRALPRPVMILIGNVAAAKEGLRRLDHQPDYNRVWPGCDEGQNTPEARIMKSVHRRVVERNAFAAIDVHNNTGRNPHYSVICENEDRVMALAAMFAPRTVLFRGLPGTQTASFSGLVPAITIECGQPGVEANGQAAADMIQKVLTQERLEAHDARDHLVCFHTLARVQVRAEVSLSRSHEGPWLKLRERLDDHNFRELEPGFVIGETNHPEPFEALNERGQDVARTFFEIRSGKILLRKSLVPAMLTTDERIIRQDCLCYLMEELV